MKLFGYNSNPYPTILANPFQSMIYWDDMTILTLGPNGSLSHEALLILSPHKKVSFATSINELFFRLADKEIVEGVIPIEIGEIFIEDTVSHLMKYDFVVTRKVTFPIQGSDELFATFFAIGKKGFKKKKESGSAFLIFSEPMATLGKQIANQARKLKIPLLKLKNLLLQEGETPVYFMEVEGHIEEHPVRTFFEFLSDKYLIKHLGSYPL